MVKQLPPKRQKIIVIIKRIFYFGIFCFGIVFLRKFLI